MLFRSDSASHDTYEINVGDGEHIFRLEAVSEGKWSETRDYTLSFYEREKECSGQLGGTGARESPGTDDVLAQQCLWQNHPLRIQQQHDLTMGGLTEYIRSAILSKE